MIKYIKKDQKINTSHKSLITSLPILKYPEYDKLFIAEERRRHPVCFVSRTLNSHEKNYSHTDKEFLAIGYAVNYFKPYLYGNKFKIETDHLPIKYLNTKYQGKEFSQRHQRWLLKL